jgi:hypothetical protein
VERGRGETETCAWIYILTCYIHRLATQPNTEVTVLQAISHNVEPPFDPDCPMFPTITLFGQASGVKCGQSCIRDMMHRRSGVSCREPVILTHTSSRTLVLCSPLRCFLHRTFREYSFCMVIGEAVILDNAESTDQGALTLRAKSSQPPRQALAAKSACTTGVKLFTR